MKVEVHYDGVETRGTTTGGTLEHAMNRMFDKLEANGITNWKASEFRAYNWTGEFLVRIDLSGYWKRKEDEWARKHEANTNGRNDHRDRTGDSWGSGSR